MKCFFKILLGLLIASLPLMGAEMTLRVNLHDGAIEGKRVGEITAFFGVPYAAPPVGPLRWQPPAPPIPWAGVRPAHEFGSRPMQPDIYRDMVFRDAGPSEDCLTVNIWTPAHRTDERLPVMVWMFGGGFIAGGTSEQRQDGAQLAEKGVVVVSVNYRLGVFGFLVLPELIAESPHHAAGNYGWLDQVAALQWVQKNIEAFGGNAANVTVFGESAGSISVSALMASPLAHGLFHRVIGESGGAFPNPNRPDSFAADRAKLDSEKLFEALGTHSLAALRALPADVLLAATSKKEHELHFGPTVDGYFISEPVSAIFAAGKQNDVPLIAGWNQDESGLMLTGKIPAAESLQKTAERDFDSSADEFLRLYSPANAARSGAEYASDRFIAYSTWAWIHAQAGTGRQPIFRYRFNRAPPTDFFGHPRGAYHSADILYVFNQFTAQPQVAWTAADHDVSALVQSYWVNFSRTGNPNGPGLRLWPAYLDRAEGKVMHLDAPPTVTTDEFRPRYEFLSRHWSK